MQIPTGKLDFFIRRTQISSYIPGRVRLYHKELADNPALGEKVRQFLLSYNEITEVEINTVSGSALILYDAERLRKNAELKKVEDYIITHARRK